jgi:hypothetical protein
MLGHLVHTPGYEERLEDLRTRGWFSRLLGALFGWL